MINEKKVLILYHSGAGSTKTIAEIYHELLPQNLINLCSIALDFDYERLESYQLLILAFPTYHCSPSTSMLEFIENMPIFNKPKQAFVFTTCGLYSGNALREFIKKCSSKNITVHGYSVYRAPATDGVLLLPPISFLFNYEKNIALKVKRDIKRIEEIIESARKPVPYPPFKFYTILNYPNQIIGKAIKHKIKLNKESCLQCNNCVDSCIRNSWQIHEEYPHHQTENCEFCFRCIHHCPHGALFLSDKTKKPLKLNQKFYNKIKKDIIKKSLTI